MADDVDPDSSVPSVDEYGTGRSAHPPVAPYLWMLCGAFAFTVMSTLAHLVRDRFAWQAIAIGRSSVPFVLTGLSAMLAGGQLVVFGPRALWLRSLAGSTSLVCTFYALTRLPVADALTLTNLFPIWIALLSWPLLHQRPGAFVWGCVVSRGLRSRLDPTTAFARWKSGDLHRVDRLVHQRAGDDRPAPSARSRHPRVVWHFSACR